MMRIASFSSKMSTGGTQDALTLSRYCQSSPPNASLSKRLILLLISLPELPELRVVRNMGSSFRMVMVPDTSVATPKHSPCHFLAPDFCRTDRPDVHLDKHRCQTDL